MDNVVVNTAARWIEQRTEKQYAFLLLAPAFLLTGVLAFWPILWTVEMSLHANSLGRELVGQFVGLQTYIDIITGKAFLSAPFISFKRPFKSALLMTVIITAVSVVLEMVIGFGQALLLNREFRGQSVMRVAFLLPWAVPVAIQGMAFFLLFTPGIGIGSEWLASVGVAHADAPLAYSKSASIVVILAEVWKQAAFVTIIVLSGLQGIDRNLYRVAKVGGASRWEQFKRITFPLVLPTVVIALIFRIIGAMRIYGAAKMTAGCNTVTTMACLAIQEFSSHRYATSASVSVILAAIVALLIGVYVVYSNSVGGRT